MSGERRPDGAADRCRFEDDVLALDDGALDATRRMVVQAHLAVCASCADLEETLDRAAAALRTSDAPALGAAETALALLPSRPAVRPALKVAAAASLAVVVAAFVAARDREPIAYPPAAAVPTAIVPTVVEQTPAEETSVEQASVERTPAAATADADAGPPGRVPSTSPEGPGTVPYVPRSLEDLPRLVADIDPSAPDAEARLAVAARRVRGAGTAGACALAALLEGVDRDTVRRALRVAEEVPSAQYATPLGRLLDDAEFGADAARQLGAIAAPAAVEQLAHGLDGPSHAAVLDVLASCRSPRAFDVLAARARSGADERLAPVLDAAVTASPVLAARLLLELAASKETAAAADAVLRDRGGALIPALVPLAGKSDGLVATAAIRALGATRDPSVVGVLRAAGTRFSLARAAAEALASMGSATAYAAAFDVASDPRAPGGLLDVFDGAEAAAPVLVQALGDARPGRRAAAVEALGRTAAPGAVTDLARAMKDASLRRAAIAALGRVGGDAAAAVLSESVNPRTADLALVHALGATGSAVAVPALTRLAREPALCVAVAEELGRIPDAEAVLSLADLLAEPRAADAAAGSLGALPAAVVVPALLDRLDDPAAAARARRALILVAGADLGRTPAAWRTWWTQRRTHSPEEPR